MIISDRPTRSVSKGVCKNGQEFYKRESGVDSRHGNVTALRTHYVTERKPSRKLTSGESTM